MPPCTGRSSANGCGLPIPRYIEVDADRTICGEEVKFGGGQVIR